MVRSRLTQLLSNNQRWMKYGGQSSSVKADRPETSFAGNRQLNQRFAMKAYLLKESLGRLWDYVYEGAMLGYLQSWIDQLRWQRLTPMEKLANLLLNHLPGILNYCKTKIPMGVVEAVNANIKALLPTWTWLPGSGLLAIKGATLGCH